MDETDQMDGSAFVAARHAAVMLDVAEAPFDPIAMLVDAEVVRDHPLSGHIRDPVAQVGAARTLYRRKRLWRADMPRVLGSGDNFCVSMFAGGRCGVWSTYGGLTESDPKGVGSGS